jgi:uncharacterized membrane protein
MKASKKVGLLFLPFFVLGAFILFTDPYVLPLPLLLIPFLLLGIGCFYSAREFLRVAAPLSRRKRNFMAGMLTSIVLLGVLLQSIRQLSIKDFLIMAVLLIGTTLYMRRIDI